MTRTSRAFALLSVLCLLVLGACTPEITSLRPLTEVLPTATPAPGAQTSIAPNQTVTASPLGPSPARTTGPSPAPSPTRTTIAVIRASPPKAGAQAVDFSLPDLEGNQVALSDFRGRNVLLNFWASWCGPCRAEIPHLVKFREEFHDQGFEILAVNMRESPYRVSQFAEQNKLRFPVVLDRTGMVSAAYFVRAIPTNILLDDEGVIRTVHYGALTESVLRKYLDRLTQ